jgi:hypothetical protein
MHAVPSGLVLSKHRNTRATPLCRWLVLPRKIHDSYT